MADSHGVIKLDIAASATQYTVVLPSNVRRFTVTPRSGQTCYVDTTSGTVATYGGTAVSQSNPFDSGKRAIQATTVYVSSPTAGSQVLIEFWSFGPGALS